MKRVDALQFFVDTLAELGCSFFSFEDLKAGLEEDANDLKLCLGMRETCFCLSLTSLLEGKHKIEATKVKLIDANFKLYITNSFLAYHNSPMLFPMAPSSFLVEFSVFSFIVDKMTLFDEAAYIKHKDMLEI